MIRASARLRPSGYPLTLRAKGRDEGLWIVAVIPGMVSASALVSWDTAADVAGAIGVAASLALGFVIGLWM